MARPTGWDSYCRGVRALQAQLGQVQRAAGGSPFAPLAEPPPRHILAAAAELGATPAILWDIAGLRDRVSSLGRLTAEYGLGLNAAIKACRTIGVLAILAESGLGADVASPAEWAVARQAGFRRISATGPGFGKGDITRLLAAGVLFDAQSLTQLAQVLDCGAGAVGLRLRVPLPDALRSSTSRGGDSRFGIPVEHRLIAVAASARVTRLRVHTGEATARILEFRTRYALLAAGLLGDVTEFNLGGGLLRLSRDHAALNEAFATARAAAGDKHCWVEPGAALLLDSGYLVTEVLDVHHDEHRPAIVVDASAWNVAPWAYPSFYLARGEPHRYGGTVFGPTLYEKDRFHPDLAARDGQQGPGPAIGDRLIGTSFGAYTISNGRCFAGLALPAQYAVTADELEVIDG
jgi:diaminopimelate decarboxylase